MKLIRLGKTLTGQVGRDGFITTTARPMHEIIFEQLDIWRGYYSEALDDESKAEIVSKMIDLLEQLKTGGDCQ